MGTAHLAPLAVAVLLALPACSGDDGGTSAPSAEPSAAASSEGGAGGAAKSYATTAEVIAALEAAGVPCEEPETGTFPGVSEAQACILGGTEDATVLRFGSPAEREEYIANKEPLASVVLGPDWAVQTVLADTAQRVGDALGGEVVLGS